MEKAWRYIPRCLLWEQWQTVSRTMHFRYYRSRPPYTNQGIKERNVLPVRIVDEGRLKKADYVGCVSGNKTDKSEVFWYYTAKMEAPVIEESPVVMEWAV